MSIKDKFIEALKNKNKKDIVDTYNEILLDKGECIDADEIIGEMIHNDELTLSDVIIFGSMASRHKLHPSYFSDTIFVIGEKIKEIEDEGKRKDMENIFNFEEKRSESSLKMEGEIMEFAKKVSERRDGIIEKYGPSDGNKRDVQQFVKYAQENGTALEAAKEMEDMAKDSLDYLTQLDSDIVFKGGDIDCFMLGAELQKHVGYDRHIAADLRGEIKKDG